MPEEEEGPGGQPPPPPPICPIRHDRHIGNCPNGDGEGDETGG